MNSIKWNYNLCVACGKCLKACFEANNKVLCYFNTLLGSSDNLYEWICINNSSENKQLNEQYNKEPCQYDCKNICPQKAIT